ncbi:MAG: ZIP family metal transporter [Candidatus Helarchaeota archaeon]
MIELVYIIISTFIVSLIALIGIVTIGINDEFLNKIVVLLVSLSAGGLIGGGFLHLLPEAVEESMSLNIYIVLIAGFILFFFIEKILDFRHCHNVKQKHICEYHTFRWLNLIGDSVHNFIDGLIIAASFLSSYHLGIITTIAVIFHEIPQEIGDFGVLVYGGFTKKKALYLNFLTAIIAIIGGIVGYFLVFIIESLTPYLLSFAAGGFLYIAASDLIPEMKKENAGKKIALIMAIFIFGIFLMWLFKIIFE